MKKKQDPPTLSMFTFMSKIVTETYKSKTLEQLHSVENMMDNFRMYFQDKPEGKSEDFQDIITEMKEMFKEKCLQLSIYEMSLIGEDYTEGPKREADPVGLALIILIIMIATGITLFLVRTN